MDDLKLLWKRFVAWLSGRKLPEFVAHHQVKSINKGFADDEYEGVHNESEGLVDADIITSLDEVTGLHRPLLDIDFPVKVIPSTTPGHYHLYIDKPMTLERYERLLDCLSDANIIEYGYAQASIDRGYTALRLPWVKKSKENA